MYGKRRHIFTRPISSDMCKWTICTYNIIFWIWKLLFFAKIHCIEAQVLAPPPTHTLALVSSLSDHVPPRKSWMNTICFKVAKFDIQSNQNVYWHRYPSNIVVWRWPKAKKKLERNASKLKQHFWQNLFIYSVLVLISGEEKKKIRMTQ